MDVRADDENDGTGMDADVDGEEISDADYDSLYGPEVLVVRTGFDGSISNTWMPAAMAVACCAYDAGNGTIYRSARIVDICDEDMGLWDRSA